MASSTPIHTEEQIVALSDIMTGMIEPVEETHVRQRGNNQYWQWFPDLIRSWVWEEQVPPPPTANTITSTWTLTALEYPLEQAFAVFVARVEQEIRNMRETAGVITGLLENNNWLTQMWDNLAETLFRTEQTQAHLVETVRMMREEILELTARLEITELRTAAAEARAEEANAWANAAANGTNVVGNLAVEAMALITGHMRYEHGVVTSPAEQEDSSSTIGPPNNGV